jgi:hypothetical protein
MEGLLTLKLIRVSTGRFVRIQVGRVRLVCSCVLKVMLSILGIRNVCAIDSLFRDRTDDSKGGMELSCATRLCPLLSVPMEVTAVELRRRTAATMGREYS